MTFAVTVKVNDGIVLAADSASSIIQVGGSVSNVYYSADKIFNLCKGLPLAAMTWGVGGIGDASISTIVKDFRSQLDADQLNKDGYTVSDIADRLQEYILPIYEDSVQGWPTEVRPHTGFLIAGYSSGKDEIEEYQVDIWGDVRLPPLLLAKTSESGIIWRGQTEAISRLVLGYSPLLPEIMDKNLGVDKEALPQAMQIIRHELEIPLVFAAMPIQDAIDLASFLVDMTINYSRFAPGAQTVGGPIEIAAITKHEGFRWIRRKHYYQQGLNP